MKPKRKRPYAACLVCNKTFSSEAKAKEHFHKAGHAWSADLKFAKEYRKLS
jgi:hypothetical protein